MTQVFQDACMCDGGGWSFYLDSSFVLQTDQSGIGSHYKVAAPLVSYGVGEREVVLIAIRFSFATSSKK